jgi:hypothetical protein
MLSDVPTESEPEVAMSWKSSWDAENAKVPAKTCKISGANASDDVITKHIIYTVESDGSVVRRRYNDFCSLREALRARFPGMLLPALPPKSQLSTNLPNKMNPNSGYVCLRKERLEYWLLELCDNPFVRNSDEFKAFFSAMEEGFKASGAMTPMNADWKAYSDNAEEIDVPSALPNIENLKAAVGASGLKLNEQEQALVKATKLSTDMIRTLNHVAAVFNDMHEVESTMKAKLSDIGKSNDQIQQSLDAADDKRSIGASSWASKMTAQPYCMVTHGIPTVRNLQMNVRGFLELLESVLLENNQADKLEEDARKLTMDKQAMLEQKGKGPEEGKFFKNMFDKMKTMTMKTVEQFETQIAQKEEHAAFLRARTKVQIKMMYHSQIDLFNLKREVSSRGGAEAFELPNEPINTDTLPKRIQVATEANLVGTLEGTDIGTVKRVSENSTG